MVWTPTNHSMGINKFKRSANTQNMFSNELKISIIRYVKEGKNKYLETKQYLNNPCFNREITRETRKYLGLKDNEDTTYENVWNAAKKCLG